MPVLICGACHLQMRPTKIGLPVELMTTAGPYQLYMADKFACPQCGQEAASGLGKPIAEHSEIDYAAQRESYNRSSAGPVIRYWGTPREKAQYELNYPEATPRGERGNQDG